MLIPIGKLVDVYGLTGQDMATLAGALPCQAPDSIMRRFYSARNQKENRILDHDLNARMGLVVIEHLVALFRTWAQERAENDFQKNPIALGDPNAIYREFINPKTAEYLTKDLSVFHQLANEACGRSPLDSWDEIVQNLNTKSDLDINLALAYLAGELKKAALECCLVDKTEAMAYLINNDYVFKQEVNGCSRAAHEAMVKELAASSHSDGLPLPPQIGNDDEQPSGHDVSLPLDDNGPVTEVEPYADMVSDLPPFTNNTQISKGVDDKASIKKTREDNPVAYDHVKRLQEHRLPDNEIIEYLKRHNCPASIGQCLLFGNCKSLGAAKTAWYGCLKSNK